MNDQHALFEVCSPSPTSRRATRCYLHTEIKSTNIQASIGRKKEPTLQISSARVFHYPNTILHSCDSTFCIAISIPQLTPDQPNRPRHVKSHGEHADRRLVFGLAHQVNAASLAVAQPAQMPDTANSGRRSPPCGGWWQPPTRTAAAAAAAAAARRNSPPAAHSATRRATCTLDRKPTDRPTRPDLLALLTDHDHDHT